MHVHVHVYIHTHIYLRLSQYIISMYVCMRACMHELTKQPISSTINYYELRSVRMCV